MTPAIDRTKQYLPGVDFAFSICRLKRQLQNPLLDQREIMIVT